MSNFVSEPQLNQISIQNRCIRDWDNKWVEKGILSEIDIEELRGHFGLYRFILDGEIVYLGTAKEYTEKSKTGLRKRLNDYLRDSDSARKSQSGQRIYLNRDSLVLELLITGTDHLSALEAAMLEPAMLIKHSPLWNSHGNPNAT